jgi:hypothetical protein
MKSSQPFVTFESEGDGGAAVIATQIARALAPEDADRRKVLDRLCALGYGETPPDRIPPEVLAGASLSKSDSLRRKAAAKVRGRAVRRPPSEQHFAHRCACGRPIRKRRDRADPKECSVCRRAKPTA